MPFDYTQDGTALGDSVKDLLSPVGASGLDPDDEQARKDPAGTVQQSLQSHATVPPPRAVSGGGATYDAMPSLETTPRFIQDAVPMEDVRQEVRQQPAAGEINALADVNPGQPTRINVLRPKLYGPEQMTHEMTHVFQNTRNAAVTPYAETSGSGQDNYSYGGQSGLEAARKSGKTIANFNAEQQAEIVRDYQKQHNDYLAKAKAGKATAADARAMYNLQQTYHPYIAQLAAMPTASTNLDPSRLKMLLGAEKDPVLAPAPAAPGLPSFDTPGLGVIPADSLMGGRSQPIPTHRATTKTRTR